MINLHLREERLNKVKGVAIGATISYGTSQSYLSTKRNVKWTDKIENIVFDKEQHRFYVEGLHRALTLRELFDEIHKSDCYRTTSKKLRELANEYYRCNKLSLEDEFHEYVDNLGEAEFKIQDVNMYEDEVEWLDKHVTNITAVFPRKYLKNFKQYFGSSEYKLRDDSWHYSFTMYFDSMEDIPSSLLQITNAEGNTLDYDHKRMSNTSYIWHLIRNHPDKFDFGKRAI